MKKIKNYTISTAVGYWLDFGDQIVCPEDIEPGMTVIISDPDDGTVSGPADGEYVMPDGGTFVFVKGVLVEMIETEAPTPAEMGKFMLKTIQIKGEVYHWIPEKKKFMRVCSGIKLRGKLYTADKNGKFNVLTKDQYSRSPGKPVTGI